MFKKIISTSVALAALVLAGSASASLIISIDNTGANDPVNVNNPRAWNFGVTAAGASYFAAHGLTFDSAMFDAKVHKDTTAPIVFSIYSGLGGNINGNTLLTSVSVPASQFDQQYQDGEGSLFKFSLPKLSMGYYSATLTSTAPDQATQDYFLKQGKLTLRDAGNDPLSSSYWLQDQGTGNATGTFNGSGSLSGGSGGEGGSGSGGSGDGGGGSGEGDGGSGGGGSAGTLAMAPEPGSIAAMAAITMLSFGGGLVRRIRKQVAL